MAAEDEIAAALPEPPPPAPARRDAAIGAALRRFDGLEGGPEARPSPSRAGARGGLSRPQLGAAIAAILVLLVGVPTAWMSLPGPSGPDSQVAAPAPPDRRTGPPQALDRPGRTGSQPGGVASAPEITAPALTRPAQDKGDCPGPGCGNPSARTDLANLPAPSAPAPAISESAPPPAPPISALAQGRAASSFAESRKSVDSAEGEELAMTGTARRRAPMAAAPRAEMADERDNAVVVTGSRIGGGASRNGRGDWNACTVDDPARSLERCRREIGAAGKAAKGLSDGLERAWSGDGRGAISALDQAIAANPRSSSLYLNRGLALSRQGDAERALADLDRAVRYAPASARAYYHRSLVLRSRGETRRADRDLARAVDLDESYRDLLD